MPGDGHEKNRLETLGRVSLRSESSTTTRSLNFRFPLALPETIVVLIWFFELDANGDFATGAARMINLTLKPGELTILTEKV